jgi:tetratricopeptide (TPR) repeat protein
MICSRIQTALFCASAIAMIHPGDVCAQLSTSEPWPRGGPAWQNLDRGDPTHWTFGNESAGFERSSMTGVGNPIYPTLTLHELAHRVPNRAAKEYGRALKAKHKGNYYDAISHFQNAVFVDPEFSAALNDLGTTYLQLSKIDLAIQQFSKAIVVDLRAALPCSNLAIAYLRQKQYRDAERTARRAVDLDRAGTHSLLVLGVALVLENRFTGEAERILTKASVEFNFAHFWLGLGLIQKGNIAGGRDELKAYLARADGHGLEIANHVLHRLESARPAAHTEVAQVRSNP